MNEFGQALGEWEIFYSTVALASVTLVGLLFVSLSIRLDRRDDKGPQEMVRLARGSFADFLYLLMLSLVFLVPHQAPIGLSVALLVLGASRGVGLARQAFVANRSFQGRRSTAQAAREMALPALASIGLLFVAVEVMRGDLVAFYGLVLVVAALMITASWNAWLILVGDHPRAPSPQTASRNSRSSRRKQAGG